jgi:hypothetical protein
MHAANVTFSCIQGMVEMTLSIDGEVIAKSSSHESIVRELQIHGARYLTIEDTFSSELPTSVGTLKLAADVDFNEKLSALRLIAACSSMGEVASFPYPERRARPKAEMPTRGSF